MFYYFMVNSEKEVLIDSLKKKGFSSEIIKAFENVDRELYFLEEYRGRAYEDTAFPIGFDQTISQPSTIAFMLDLLELKEDSKVLEVGSGSGYVLSLISEISKNKEKIFGIEIISEFVVKSRRTLKAEGKEKIRVYHNTEEVGLSKYAPFNRILVSASARKVPKDLISQLEYGGIMVLPVGDSIFKITKRKEGISSEEFPGFSFVPLI
jgi:protein-L-isoaspartate(D-aspartate) O-methyltransferase